MHARLRGAVYAERSALLGAAAPNNTYMCCCISYWPLRLPLWALCMPLPCCHAAVLLTVLMMMTRLCYDVLHCDWTAWVTCHGWYMLTVWMLTAGALVLDVLRV